MARACCLTVLALALVLTWTPGQAPAKKRTAASAKRCTAKKAPRPRACRARSTSSWRLMRQPRPRAGLVDLSPRTGLPGAPAPAPVSDTGPAPVYSRFVAVRADEWFLALSRPIVGAGEVTVQLQNRGEDDHNLHIRPEGGATVARIPDQQPGRVGEVQPVLGPGRYHLWCDLTGHEAAGMSATLEVR